MSLRAVLNDGSQRVTITILGNIPKTGLNRGSCHRNLCIGFEIKLMILKRFILIFGQHKKNNKFLLYKIAMKCLCSFEKSEIVEFSLC